MEAGLHNSLHPAGFKTARLIYGNDGVTVQVMHAVSSVVGFMVYGNMQARFPNRMGYPGGRRFVVQHSKWRSLLVHFG
jgi:hypothetical protein